MSSLELAPLGGSPRASVESRRPQRDRRGRWMSVWRLVRRATSGPAVPRRERLLLGSGGSLAPEHGAGWCDRDPRAVKRARVA